MSDVFISYSRKDKDFVRQLNDALLKRSRETWVDWQDIPPTAEWMAEIHAGIEEADNFVFVISPDSVASPICQEELEHAVKNNKRLIPIVYREVEQSQQIKSIAHINWIFFTQPREFDASIKLLADALSTDLEYVNLHTRLQVRAIEWDKSERGESYLLVGELLNNAQKWLAGAHDYRPSPTALHVEYIHASEAVALERSVYERKRRRRTLAVTLGGVAVIAVLVALLVVPLLTPDEIVRMKGDWNVAVASFTPLGDIPIDADEAEEAGRQFFNRVKVETDEFTEQHGRLPEYRAPEEIGMVKGDTPEKRARNAAALAKQLEAHIIVYGNIYAQDDMLFLQPEFYIASESFFAAEEVTGDHAYGDPILLGAVTDDFGELLGQSEQVAKRAESLNLLIDGLERYMRGSYDDALASFKTASQPDLWKFIGGRETVLFFEGAASYQLQRVDDAERAFAEANEVSREENGKDYARAHLGLAMTSYMRAMQTIPINGIPDNSQFLKTEEHLDAALHAELSPVTAEIEIKVEYIRGQIDLFRWQYCFEFTPPCSEAEWNIYHADAMRRFQLVIDAYEVDGKKSLKQHASDAYGYLARIEHFDQHFEEAIGYYDSAISLTSLPDRQGNLYALQARVYKILAEQSATDPELAAKYLADAERQWRAAIGDFENALSVTSAASQEAILYASMGEVYFYLGEFDVSEYDRAIRNYEEAIDLAEDGSDEQARFMQALSYVERAADQARTTPADSP